MVTPQREVGRQPAPGKDASQTLCSVRIWASPPSAWRRGPARGDGGACETQGRGGAGPGFGPVNRMVYFRKLGPWNEELFPVLLLPWAS